MCAKFEGIGYLRFAARMHNNSLLFYLFIYLFYFHPYCMIYNTRLVQLYITKFTIHVQIFKL